ncbi:response regulator transcription factor [Corynebacterium sp. 320]|uniref:response regulator transcription factor n=1 Tax=Corynebacterium TaxID=1716 RepID=UPI00125CD0F1|nr:MULTISPECIES: response regulator transcription factor [Corynebacterium]KAB1504379.1 response regulator transcription factor [Corynebacterium sp. 320]KAB1552522.1 response regulator transcription factor [Corynebacterium sp. 321]KAB1554264.1 response regulator transcription factor [Corynebacterium sp. 319]KAB3528515.1 response regulator transcription factor [Corynebacterium sp. 250]KAB3539992.1 response regulator transcription factor [Corynebacterium sp. 366]
MSTRILIIDNDPTILDTLPAHFSSARDMTIIDVMASGMPALEWLDENTCDLILTGMELPDIDQWELIEHLQRDYPVPFIVLASEHSEEAMLECLRMGAVGYVLKSQTPDAILAAVRNAAHGGAALSIASVRRLVEMSAACGGSAADGLMNNAADILSESELLVLDLLLQGFPNKRIAEELNYSVSSIKQKTSAILKATGTASRTELIAKYHQS